MQKLAQKFLSFFIVLGILMGFPVEARVSKPKATQKSAHASRAKKKVVKTKASSQSRRTVKKTIVKSKTSQRKSKLSQWKSVPVKRNVKAALSKKIPQKRAVSSKKIKPSVKVNVKENKVTPKTIRNVPEKINPNRLKSNSPSTTSNSVSRDFASSTVSPSQLKEGSNPIQQKKRVEPQQKEISLELQNFLNTKFDKNSHTRLAGDYSFNGNFNTCDLGFSKNSRTKQYTLLKLPAAPILHPYHPISDTTMEEYFVPAYTLNVKLPNAETSLFPQALQSILAKQLEAGAIKDVESYVEVQDMPWKAEANGQISLLFRPLYWCSPDEPNEKKGTYSKSFTVRTGIFSKGPNAPKLTGQKETELITEVLTIHNSGPDTPLVSSGDSLPVNGIVKKQSHAFYSLTIHESRAAVTKHIILNHTDESEFEKLLAQSTTLEDLRDQLEKNRKAFSKPDLIDEFNDLWAVH